MMMRHFETEYSTNNGYRTRILTEVALRTVACIVNLVKYVCVQNKFIKVDPEQQEEELFVEFNAFIYLNKA
jgi:hypothetical protein